MFKGNRIYIISKNGKRKRVFWVPKLHISFKGKNSIVELCEPLPKFRKGCRVRLGDNCKLHIGGSKYAICKLEVFLVGKNNECYIDDNFYAISGCEIHCDPEENLSVKIGKNTLVGRNTLIRATDGHTIYNEDNKQILNPGKNITIGNHVWLAENVSILKGVVIPDNCVVGLKSTVTKSVEQANSLLVGVPARVVKTGINWSFKSTNKFLGDKK